MVNNVMHEQGQPPAKPFLCAVKALDRERRDDALFLLARDQNAFLTQYDVCKTQVLADVFHVIQTGRAIFGGELYALPYGPVVDGTLDDCKRWARGLLAAVLMTFSAPHGPLEFHESAGANNQVTFFRAGSHYPRRDVATWDDFSDSEATAIRTALAKVKAMGSLSGESQRYFHEPISAVGYAYYEATKRFSRPFKSSVAMNWFDVLDGAQQIEGKDVSYARAALGLWV